MALRVTKSYRQLNTGEPSKVFPLLCPVREKDWIDGWEYEMIYSKSGLAEYGCVFTTPTPNGNVTTWYVTGYSRENYTIEFVRVTPAEMAVKINIQLLDAGKNQTISDITYEYTALGEKGSEWIRNSVDTAFVQTMEYWEKAINHYLATGQKLLK
jgi:hypothetical protein